MSDLQIKQFQPRDEAALLSFLRAAYPDDPRRSERAFWRWHFLEHPHVKRDDVPIWLVKDNERIAAQLAAIPAHLKIGDEREQAIWIMDVYVHQDYRRRGLARRLWLAAGESYSRMFGLGINEQSKAVVMGLSWIPMGHIHRYHRLLFPGDALKDIQRLGPLRGLVNLGYAPFRRRLARRSAQAAGLSVVREIREFDASFDHLWQRARQQWPCAVERDARYLEWQFMRQPGKRFDTLGLYLDEQLIGYVVLFFRKSEQAEAPPKAAITDLCYDASASPMVIDELLKAALRLALERRAGSLVTDVLDARVEERLRDFGFRRIKTAPEFIANPGAPPLMYDRSNWFLTRADSDVSIFEQPNL
jgi:ribosomal protein S18 acetylase RimI-like enzyme